MLLALAVAAGAQEFDSSTVSTEMVAMRDGVRLATDVYRCRPQKLRPRQNGAPVTVCNVRS